MSKRYKIIRNLYRMHKIDARTVWEYVDSKELTENEVILICGPRPEK